MIRIDTPENIYAAFFMRGDSVAEADVMPSQVHGDNIIHICDDNCVFTERPKADGLLLSTASVSASMRFADCAPVLVWGTRWAMLLHSGFKGTVLNISGKGIELVRRLYGHDDIFAWVGPCIGRDDYERDLNEEWSMRGIKAFHRENYDVKDAKVYFDLAGEIKTQLTESGVKNITLSGINTYRTPECYSYRRGDLKDRMTLYVRLKNV